MGGNAEDHVVRGVHVRGDVDVAFLFRDARAVVPGCDHDVEDVDVAVIVHVSIRPESGVFEGRSVGAGDIDQVEDVDVKVVVHIATKAVDEEQLRVGLQGGFTGFTVDDSQEDVAGDRGCSLDVVALQHRVACWRGVSGGWS